MFNSNMSVKLTTFTFVRYFMETNDVFAPAEMYHYYDEKHHKGKLMTDVIDWFMFKSIGVLPERFYNTFKQYLRFYELTENKSIMLQKEKDNVEKKSDIFYYYIKNVESLQNLMKEDSDSDVEYNSDSEYTDSEIRQLKDFRYDDGEKRYIKARLHLYQYLNHIQLDEPSVRDTLHLYWDYHPSLEGIIEHECKDNSWGWSYDFLPLSFYIQYYRTLNSFSIKQEIYIVLKTYIDGTADYIQLKHFYWPIKNGVITQKQLWMNHLKRHDKKQRKRRVKEVLTFYNFRERIHQKIRYFKYDTQEFGLKQAFKNLKY